MWTIFAIRTHGVGLMFAFISTFVKNQTFVGSKHYIKKCMSIFYFKIREWELPLSLPSSNNLADILKTAAPQWEETPSGGEKSQNFI